MGEVLGAGSISLRLYPHDLPPAELVAELAAQARLAEEVGFDGVMVSEHHAGFPNYVPNPLLAATWALEATETAWAAACPMLLPLRPANQVIEDFAWTAQRFPGRIGAGFASGALEDDFTLSGVPFDEMRDRFRAALPLVVAGLRGRADGLVASDPAVQALAGAPIAVVSAAQSPAAARRAGLLGIGLLFDSLIGAERAAEVSAAHLEAGGRGARILIRRAWLGEPPSEAVDAQMDRYRRAASMASRSHWGAGDGVVAGDRGDAVAEGLLGLLEATGCDALNLRVFHAGMAPLEARRQIEQLGSEVLPLLRAGLAG